MTFWTRDVAVTLRWAENRSDTPLSACVCQCMCVSVHVSVHVCVSACQCA